MFPLTEISNEEPVVSTGISGLDNVLNGGLPRGHFFLVQGEPGAGKTTLGLQFLMAGIGNREAVLYVTLSESEKEIPEAAGDRAARVRWPQAARRQNPS